MIEMLLAQTGTAAESRGAPVRLITQEPSVLPTPAPATIDPLWVLLGLVALAVVVAAVLIARTVWLDVLAKRPSQAAYWLLAVRRGVRPGQMSLLRRAAGAMGEQVHPVAMLCSPTARAACAAAYLRARPSTSDAARLTRLVQRLDREDARPADGRVLDQAA